jgi:hypothetical protein
MIVRLLKAALLAAVIAAFVQSVPDIKRSVPGDAGDVTALAGRGGGLESSF